MQIVFSKTFERHDNGDSGKFSLPRVLELVDILIEEGKAVSSFHAVFDSLNLSVPSIKQKKTNILRNKENRGGG